MDDEEYELILSSELKLLKEENISLRQKVKELGGDLGSISLKDESKNESSKVDVEDLGYEVIKDKKHDESVGVDESQKASKDDGLFKHKKEAVSNVQVEGLPKEVLEIREFSKQILDTLILKTEGLDSKFNEMVSSVQELVNSIADVVNEIPKEERILREITNVEKMVSKKLSSGVTFSTGGEVEGSDKYIVEKLHDIDIFMKNLRILLSYVKPADMKVEKEA